MTLLKTAKKLKTNKIRLKKRIGKKEIEKLIVAWLIGKVTATQAQYAIYGKHQGSNFYVNVATTLIDMFLEGKIKIKKI